MANYESLLALKARFVFPVAGPPIPGGCVTICGPSIVAVGSKVPDCPVQDLGNVAILPGFVNAHTHLEFSDLAVPIGRPSMPLPDWIRQVIEHRRATADAGPSAAMQGLRESLAAGTTALGEIATSDWRSNGRLEAELRSIVVMFHESIAPLRDRIARAVWAAEKFLLWGQTFKRVRPGLSPHAPYTVHPELLASLVELSQRFQVPLAMHLAESREEIELLRGGSGPFRELLEDLQSWDPLADARYPRIFDYLVQLARAPRALVIHGNYLDRAELDFLADRAEAMAVVYCPRTHHFFGHPSYPLARMLAMNISMALGTDSRASNPDLSLFEEMRFVAERHNDVMLSKILELGTLAGARALGLDRQMGTLEPGKLANLNVVRLDDASAGDPHELLFAPTARVVQTWVRGEITEQAADE
ncbi:MAG: amidohydrolase family protein [Planctomycetia bacterium]|nr:amidohydrolase family protein [Planctomycetia bacterium]